MCLQLPQPLALGLLLHLHHRRRQVRNRGIGECRHRRRRLRRLRLLRYGRLQAPLRQVTALTVAGILATQQDPSYQSQPPQLLGLQLSLPDSILGIAESVDFAEVLRRAIGNRYKTDFSPTEPSPPGQHLAHCGVSSGFKAVPAEIQHLEASATGVLVCPVRSLTELLYHQTCAQWLLLFFPAEFPPSRPQSRLHCSPSKGRARCRRLRARALCQGWRTADARALPAVSC